MTTFATRLQSNVDTAVRVRLADQLPITATSGITAATGLRPGGGGEVDVVAGTMTVQVQPFVARIEGDTTGQGGYPFVVDAAEVLTLADGDASLPRTDLIVGRVYDDAYDTSGLTVAQLEVVQGAPGGPAPAVPPQATPLREVTVPAGASAGTGGLSSSALGNDRREYLVAAGGVLPVEGVSERDALDVHPGRAVFREDTGAVEVWNGSGWDTYEPANDTGWVELGTPSGHWGQDGVNPVRYRTRGKLVELAGEVRRGDEFTFTANGQQGLWTLPQNLQPSSRRVGSASPTADSPDCDLRLLVLSDGEVRLSNRGPDGLPVSRAVHLHVCYLLD